MIEKDPLFTAPVMSTNTLTTAFLAALATTPVGEALPPLDVSLWNRDRKAFFTKLRSTAHPSLWQRCQAFHDQLVKGYTVKERAKILRSSVSSEESDKAAEMEITNVTLSAEEIISSPEPIQKARESYVESGLDPLSWSAGLTGWQP